MYVRRELTEEQVGSCGKPTNVYLVAPKLKRRSVFRQSPGFPGFFFPHSFLFFYFIDWLIFPLTIAIITSSSCTSSSMFCVVYQLLGVVGMFLLCFLLDHI